MYSLLDNVFKEYGYKRLVEKGVELDLYSLAGDDFYIISSYDIEEFSNFFDGKRTNSIVDDFNKLESKLSGLAKNTSFIIFIEVENIETFYTENKNQIMKIEEDEYFFRKYVIIYNESSIRFFKLNQQISKQLYDVLSADEKMNKFENNLFFDDEFVVSMQLMIKIPFIQLQENKKILDLLDKKINKKIAYDNLEENNSSINDLLLIIENDADYFEELENAILNDKEDTIIIKNLYSTFKVDKK